MYQNTSTLLVIDYLIALCEDLEGMSLKIRNSTAIEKGLSMYPCPECTLSTLTTQNDHFI